MLCDSMLALKVCQYSIFKISIHLLSALTETQRGPNRGGHLKQDACTVILDIREITKLNTSLTTTSE